MSRTLGFFLGSAVVFAMLVFVLGRPVPLAPPSSRDSNLNSGSYTTTAPVLVPAPASEPDTTPEPERQAAAQPAPVAEVVTVPSDEPDQAVAATDVVVEAEPIAKPVVVEYQDENALVENWLATTAGQPVDNGLPAEDQSDSPIDSAIASLSQDPAGVAPVAGQSGELEWFPVWDPFHSELSANAFARRLERITGLDYRVIKTGATQYRVAMGYASEEQRLVNVEMIEEATGLSITGGSR